jgi:hypothetical protein
VDDDDAGCGKSACELRWLEILLGFIRDFFECTRQPKKAGQTAAAAAKAWKRPANVFRRNSHVAEGGHVKARRTGGALSARGQQ